MAPVDHDAPVSVAIREKPQLSANVEELTNPGPKYGKEMLKNFLFEPGFRNLNHGKQLITSSGSADRRWD
jgi:hypothetical protein